MPELETFEIRRLSGADAEAFRLIRLEGLQRYPQAFGASFREENEQPLAFFGERLEQNYVLGAAGPNGLAGVAGFRLHDSEKTRHRATLWGMYVREAVRGKGIGRRLVDGILDHARRCVEEIGLSVWTENPAAMALYRSAGFVVVAKDERALKIDGVYCDHLLMQVRFG